MFRHFKKNIFTTILNIIGLSVAFAAFIIILIQVRYDLGYNKGFKDSDRIYRLEGAFNLSNLESYSNYMSRPLAARIGTCSPYIEAWGDLAKWTSEVNVKKTDTEDAPFMKIKMDVIQKGILEVLGYEIISGDTTTFAEPGNIIIAESVANTLFPGESPLGKTLMHESNTELNIIAVYKDFPENCCMYNGIVREYGKQGLDNYSEWSSTVLLKLTSSEHIREVEERMVDIMFDMFKDQEEIINAYKDSANGMLRLSPIHDTHFSKDIQYDWMEKASLATTYSLLVIAFLIIIIAIINFVNFSMAGVPLTIKGINTRKVLGCSNGSLRLRQITEAIVISLIAFAISILLVFILAGTSFTAFISGSIAVQDNLALILLTAAVSILSGVFAGIYPAIYSTSFSPAMVVKGSFSLSPKGRMLRSSLVALQYVISMVLIIVALFINVQSKFMKSYDMGFRSNDILTVSLSNTIANKQETFTQKLKENPNIIDAAYSREMLVSNGKMGWSRFHNGENMMYDCFPVSSNFLDFFGLKVVEGRNFVIEDNNKAGGTYIFNETAVKTYPSITVGDKMRGHIEDENVFSDVVGIAKDFNFQPLNYKIHPIAIYVFGSNPWWPLPFCYIKTIPGSDTRENMEYITKVINEMDPSFLAEDIEIIYMDDRIGQLYEKEDALGNLILIFCGLSVLISIIGILGLIFFETQFKKKEIGVRRVFGSSVTNILTMLNATYLKIAFICFLIAIPIAIIIIKQWLKSFSYQAPIPVWIFAASLAIIVAITILVITLQSYRSASANPVDSVRSE